MSQISSSNGDQPTKKSDVGDASTWTRLKRIRGTGALATVLENKTDVTNPPATVTNAVINGQRISEFGTSRTRRSTSTWTDFKAFSASYIAPIIVTLDIMNAKIADLLTANPPPVAVISPEPRGGFFGQLEAILASYTTYSTVLVSIYNSVSEYYSRAPFSFTGSIYAFTSDTVTNEQLLFLPSGSGFLIPQFSALTIGDSTYQVENIAGGRLIKKPLLGGSSTFFTRNSSVTTTGLTPNVTFTYLGSGSPGLATIISGSLPPITATWDPISQQITYTVFPSSLTIPGLPNTTYEFRYRLIAGGTNTYLSQQLGTYDITSSTYINVNVPKIYRVDCDVLYSNTTNFRRLGITLSSNDVTVLVTDPVVNVSVSNVTVNSAILNWSPMTKIIPGDNLIGYNIYSGFSTTTLVGTVGPNVTTYTVTGLSTFTSYSYYNVRARYQSQVSGISESSMVSFRTLTQAVRSIIAGYDKTTGLYGWNLVGYGNFNDGFVVDARNEGVILNGDNLNNPISMYYYTSRNSGTFPVRTIRHDGGTVKSNIIDILATDVLTLSASNITFESVYLSWNAYPGATSYKIYKSGVFVTEILGTNYTVTPISPIKHYFVVIPIIPTGEGNAGGISLVAGPNIVATYNSTTRQVSLVTTNPPPSPLAYSIKQVNTNIDVTGSTYSSSPIQIPSSAPAAIGSGYKTITSTVQLLVNGVAVNSNTFNVIFGNIVSGLVISNVSGTNARINWDPLPGVLRFELEFNGVYIGSTNPTTNTYLFDSLSLNTSYTFSVTPRLNIGRGGTLGTKATLSFTTTNVAPTLLPPANLVATGQIGTVGFGWDPVPGVLGYRIITNGSNPSALFTGTYASVGNGGLLAGTVITWSILSVSETETSAISATVSATSL